MKQPTSAVMHHTVLPLLCFSLMLLPTSPAQALNDKTVQDSPCSIINTGEISGTIELKCPGLSDKAIANIEKLLDEQRLTLKEQRLTMKTQRDTLDNQNSHIALLQEKIASLKADREKALQENKQDQQKQPTNPLLEQEQQALLDYDFLKAAELREAYYQQARKAKLQQREQLNTELAQEALIAAERWETAFKLSKALERYQEAADFKPDLPEAWRGVHQTAKKLGNYQLALAAAQSMQKHLNPEKDIRWLSIAYTDEGDALTSLGQNKSALKKYLKAQKSLKALSNKNGNSPSSQRDLSVSHNKVGDMHKANGDNKAALNAYQDGLEIAKQLAKIDPNVVEWQTDLVVSYYKIAQIQEDNRHQLLSDALTILQHLHKADKLDHERKGWIPILEQAVQEAKP